MRYYLDLAIRSKLLTVLALAALLAATWVDWQWVWGVFFLYWAWGGIATGQAFMVRTIDRSESPALFWTISITWLVLSGMIIFYDLFPETARLWIG